MARRGRTASKRRLPGTLPLRRLRSSGARGRARERDVDFSEFREILERDAALLVVPFDERVPFANEQAAPGFVELEHVEVLGHVLNGKERHVRFAFAKPFEKPVVNASDGDGSIGRALIEAPYGFIHERHHAVVDREDSNDAPRIRQVEGVLRKERKRSAKHGFDARIKGPHPSRGQHDEAGANEEFVVEDFAQVREAPGCRSHADAVAGGGRCEAARFPKRREKAKFVKAQIWLKGVFFWHKRPVLRFSRAQGAAAINGCIGFTLHFTERAGGLMAPKAVLRWPAKPRKPIRAARIARNVRTIASGETVPRKRQGAAAASGAPVRK